MRTEARNALAPLVWTMKLWHFALPKLTQFTPSDISSALLKVEHHKDHFRKKFGPRIAVEIPNQNPWEVFNYGAK